MGGCAAFPIKTLLLRKVAKHECCSNKMCIYGAFINTATSDKDFLLLCIFRDLHICSFVCFGSPVYGLQCCLAASGSDLPGHSGVLLRTLGAQVLSLSKVNFIFQQFPILTGRLIFGSLFLSV